MHTHHVRVMYVLLAHVHVPSATPVPGDPIVDANGTSTTTVEWQPLDSNPYLIAYHVIALIWIVAFITACQAYVISGSTSMWYFTRYYPVCDVPLTSPGFRVCCVCVCLPNQ